MATRRAITGGTLDVNPQYFNMAAVQSAADTTTTTSFNIPIQRLPTHGRAQVMEILKVFWFPDSAIVETDNSIEAYMTTSSFGTTAVNFDEPRVFAAFTRDIKITTSGQIVNEGPIIQDLSDGAGHGILIATDQIFLQIQSSSTSAAQAMKAKLLYRWKNVGLAEYIGVVQSQQ